MNVNARNLKLFIGIRALYEMPRHYKRSSCKNKWTDEQLQAALQAIRSGEMKPYSAAIRFGIPSSTLYDHMHGKSKKRYGGRPTTLTDAEEKEIAIACQVLQQFGFPLTTDIVGVIVSEYLTTCGRKNPFKDSTPGYDWWCGFLRRWPELSQRKPQHLPRHRAEGASHMVKEQ